MLSDWMPQADSEFFILFIIGLLLIYLVKSIKEKRRSGGLSNED